MKYILLLKLSVLVTALSLVVNPSVHAHTDEPEPQPSPGVNYEMWDNETDGFDPPITQSSSAVNESGERVTPEPSVMASMAGSQVQTNVDHSTGTLNINIPLVSIDDVGLYVPVSLSYKASGIKLTDVPSEVGLGWNLNAGGRVTRMVRGFPDESLSAGTSKVCGFMRRTDRLTFESIYKEVFKIYGKLLTDIKTHMDIEPDIFAFEIPGASGMFFFDEDGIAHTMPYQNIDIQWINYDYFQITDQAGNLYTLGRNNKEYTLTTFPTPDYLKEEETVNYVSSWLLESIVNYRGTISFSYVATDDITTTNETARETFYVESKSTSPTITWRNSKKESETDIYKTTNIIYGRSVLSSIKSPNMEIRFGFDVTSGRRPTRAIKTVSIYYLGNINKSYELTYNKFNNGNLKLTGILETMGGRQRNMCKFAYSNTTLPKEGTIEAKYDYDAHGYYNGRGNRWHIPSFTLRHTSSAKNSYKKDNLPNLALKTRIYSKFPNELNEVQFEGANRAPNLTYIQADILQRIDYPTGSYTYFTYQLNRVEADVLGQRSGNVYVGGVRIGQITHSDNSSLSMITKYTYNKGVPIARLTDDFYYASHAQVNKGRLSFALYSHPMYSLTDMAGRSVIYTNVTETYSNGGYTIYKFTPPAYAGAEFYGKTYDNENDEQKSSFSTGTHGTYGLVPYFLPTNSFFWHGGLPSWIQMYNDEGKMVGSIDYTYSYGPTKGSLTAYTLSPALDREIYKFRYISQAVYKTREISSTLTQREITTNYTYNHTFAQPEKITTNYLGGDQVVIEMLYADAFSSTSSNAAVNYIKDKKLPFPIQTITKYNGRIVGGEGIEYVLKGTSTKHIEPKTKWQLFLDNPVSSVIKPTLTSTGINFDSRFEKIETVLAESSDGKPLSTWSKGNYYNSVVYGHNNLLPIAYVQNAIYDPQTHGKNEVYYTSFEEMDAAVNISYPKTGKKALRSSVTINLSKFVHQDYLVTYWKSSNQLNWEKVEERITVSNSKNSHTVGSSSYYIDELRIIPVDARISTVSYNVGVGKISECDHNGNTVYYEYDSFGRLIKVLDNDRNVVKEYEYKILNEFNW